jgi:rRNA maturation endonuclease Nob1
MSKRHVDQMIWDKKLKRCSECAEAVQPEAKVCKHCGHRFGELVLGAENREPARQYPAPPPSDWMDGRR